jgi:SAM-dependent methyltransferase
MTHTPTRKQFQEAEVLRVLAGNEGGPARSLPGRIMTDWRFGVRAFRHLLNLPMRLETEDRRLLEQVIFPYLTALPSVRRVLFVGCDWYTKHYRRTFFKGLDYWTIDPAERARKFAGRQHVVGPLEELGVHFPADHFDLIVCNGVFGCGLDGKDECERAFALCHSRLKPGGIFVLGWDDIPARVPVPLSEIDSLTRFKSWCFPPLRASHYLTDTPYRHVYDFFWK